MYTKTGLRVRGTRPSSLLDQPGIRKKLPPLEAPVAPPLSQTKHSSMQHRQSSLSRARLRRPAGRLTTLPKHEKDKGAVYGRTGVASSSVKEGVLSESKGSRRGRNSGREGRAGGVRSRSAGAAYIAGTDAASTAEARDASIRRGSARRRKKPQWDDSLRDQSQYKLTPEEAVQRKMALVSKHNTLAFGLGHGRAANSKRLPGARVVVDKRVKPAASVAAAEGGGGKKRSSRRVGAKDQVLKDRGSKKKSDGSNDSVHAGGSGGGAAGVIRSTKDQGMSLHSLVGVSDIDAVDEETLWLEEHSGLSGDGGGFGGDVSVNGMTPPTTYRYRHHDTAVATAAAERGDSEGALADSDHNLIDLSGIEFGIEAFSQRVSRLEIDRKSVRSEYGDSDEEKDKHEEETEQEVEEMEPTAAAAVTTKEPITDQASSDYPRNFDARELGQTSDSQHTCRENVGFGSDGDSVCRNCRGNLRALSPSGKDGDLVKRIRLLEAQVRALPLVATASELSNEEASGVGGTESTECGRQETERDGASAGNAGERQVENRILQAHTIVEWRTVMAGLISLSAGLLQRATAAESRLRDVAHAEGANGTAFEKPTGSGTGRSPVPPEDEEVELLMARAKFMTKEGKTGEEKGKRIGSYASQLAGDLEDTTSASSAVISSTIAETPASTNPNIIPLLDNYRREERRDGRETPAPGARDSSHGQGRQRPRPLEGLPPASAVPATDHWREALDAVSTLVASPPVSEKAAPIVSRARNDFQPIHTFGGDGDGDGDDGHDFGSSYFDRVALRHARPLPRAVLAPMHHSVVSAARENSSHARRGPDNATEKTRTRGLPAIEKARVSSAAAAAGSDGAAALEWGYTTPRSIEAIPPTLPTPSQKPKHPFEQHGRVGGRQSMPPAPVHHRRRLRQSNHHQQPGTSAAEASGLVSPRSLSFHSGGSGSEGRRESDGELSSFAAPVGEWYTPPPRW